MYIRTSNITAASRPASRISSSSNNLAGTGTVPGILRVLRAPPVPVIPPQRLKVRWEFRLLNLVRLNFRFPQV
jgi:hypothetical protein